MEPGIVFPETYRNCCKIPHWICSIVICVIFFIIAISAFIMSTCVPTAMQSIYSVGASFAQIRIAGGLTSLILMIACSLFAYGISRDWALALLAWIIMLILLWKVHLILLVCSFVYILLKIDGPNSTDWARIIMLFIAQVIWLVLIIMVGRHWYAICEEIYAQEYGVPRTRSNRGGRSDRRMLMSNRSRISYTQRVGTRQLDDKYIYNRPVV